MKILILSLMVLLLTACTYNQTAPPTINKFDQAWSAANGALVDQGVNITNQNRGTGFVQGSIDGAEVKITLFSQANGGVRVEFDTSGTTKHARSNIEQIASSYNRRMGR